MATFHLQISTPDCLVFDGQAERIILRTVGGDVCILAHHIDYAAPLGIGEGSVTDAEGVTRKAAVNGGMLSVAGGVVRVIATTFEWADEIDLARAEQAEAEARRQLETLSREDRSFSVAEARLKRAITRIHVKG